MGIARSTYYDEPRRAVDDTALVEVTCPPWSDIRLECFRAADVDPEQSVPG
jgi:hypothetical protein